MRQELLKNAAIPLFGYMEPDKIDYRELDAGIREAVMGLNKIPFLATTASCEGHVKKKNDFGEYVGRDELFITRGFIAFEMDHSYEKSREFSDDLIALMKRHEPASFSRIYIWDRHFYMIEAAGPKQSSAELGSKSEIRSKKVAYQRLWSDVAKLARKYSL